MESGECVECPVQLNCSLPGPHGRKSEAEAEDCG